MTCPYCQSSDTYLDPKGFWRCRECKMIWFADKQGEGHGEIQGLVAWCWKVA